MEIQKTNSEVVAERVSYTSTSENFAYEIINVKGNGQNQTTVTAKKGDVQAATMNSWGNSQSNINFNVELTLEEEIELITSFEEIKTKLA